mmetsp:Transcript_27109/g.64807  ORF Transcript_27109/g.64807 Transcript_27109/m.64807 type:complete len:538 (-) Transcript_27109:103-1716(-)
MTSMSTPPQSPVRTTTSSSTSMSSTSSSSSMILLSPVGRFAARRRALEVDGRPLQHWDRQNFEPHRDETCRVVYEPKQGPRFFQKNLQQDDYQIMRRHSLLLEQPYFSKYVRYFPKRGYFACKACGNPLYGHASKFDAEDGWPAFGTCIEGSVGIQTNEERQTQIREEHGACTKLQALVRGALCRIKVTQMLDGLIEDLLKQRAAQVAVPVGGDGGTTAGTTSVVVGNGQQEVTAAATGGGDQTSNKEDTTTKKGKYTGRYTWVQELGEDYLELHCHRCKCHLGDIVEEENDGRQHGQTFNEHHRVNGRALKFVEDDLPRRVRTDCSLLFANETQRRLLGLPDRSKMLGGSSSSTHSSTNPSFPLRTTPFISPRTRRRTLSNDRSTGVSFQSPRKDEKWSTTKTSIAFGGGGSKLRGRGGGVTGRRFPTNSSSLSVSCHARPMQVPFLNHDDDADDDGDYSYDDLNDESFSSTQDFGSSSFNNGSSHHSNSILSGSIHSTGTASTIHSKPRRKKKTSINVRERKAALEDFMLSRSMH